MSGLLLFAHADVEASTGARKGAQPRLDRTVRLKTLCLKADNTPEVTEACYLLASELYRTGRRSEAASAFEKAVGNDDLADYALYYLAKTRYETKAFEKALAAAVNLTKDFPDSRWAEHASLMAARSLYELGRCGEALPDIERFISERSDSSALPEALETKAKCLEKQGAAQEAYEIYRRLRVEFPLSAEAVRARSALSRLAGAAKSLPGLSPEDRLNRAVNLAGRGGHREAREEFALLVKEMARRGARLNGSGLYAEALFRLGEASFNSRRYPGAVSAMREVLSLETPADRRREAILLMARAYQRSGMRNKASLDYRRLIDTYPGSAEAGKAMFLLADMAEGDGNASVAGELYADLYGQYPGHELADKALWRAAWLHYLAGSYELADSLLGELRQRYSNSIYSDTALYWQGRIMEKIGRDEAAAVIYADLTERFPLSYYASLARTKVTSATPLQGDIVSAAAEEGDESEFSPRLARIVNKGQTLLRIGMMNDGAIELSRAASRCGSSGELLAVGRLMMEAGDYSRTLRIGSNRIRPSGDFYDDDPVSGAWPLAFPLGYIEEIAERAERQSVDPHLVHAVVREESSYRKEAVSKAGAMGLMQLLPVVGKTLHKRAGVKKYSKAALFKPETNISIGSYYLSSLIRRFDGNIPLALASYNAGPNNVKKWIARYGTDEMDEFIEMIPFDETRNYVKKVLRSYDLYRRLYGKEEGQKEAQNGSAASFL